MSTPDDHRLQVLAIGKHLQLVRKGRWEFVQRTRPVKSAFIGAITPNDCIILTEEARIPVDAIVIGCPAGLIGDNEGSETESLELAVNRELREEAGYEAADVRLLINGPSSPGMTDEVISVVLARNLTKVGAGGGIGNERITLHEVPLTEVDEWLRLKEMQGRLIDPKVYTVLYFVRNREM